MVGVVVIIVLAIIPMAFSWALYRRYCILIINQQDFVRELIGQQNNFVREVHAMASKEANHRTDLMAAALDQVAKAIPHPKAEVPT